MKLIIAIDGPAGSGKSTLAKTLAAKLGVEWLDTGAMYRAVTLVAIETGVIIPGEDTTPYNNSDLERLAKAISIEFDGNRMLVDGIDVTREIRTPRIDAAVSKVASDKGVRDVLVSSQQRWVKRRESCVIEGRDIGTVVCPKADIKLFLTADADVRAIRKDSPAPAIQNRDLLDSTRRNSPLIPAEDAVVLDSTNLGVKELVDEIVEMLRLKGLPTVDK